MLTQAARIASGDVAVVAGIATTCYGRGALLDAIVLDCKRPSGGPPKLLFDVNGHAVALYHSDPAYRAALDAADIVHADGQAIVFASRVLCKRPIVERSATTDLIYDAAARAEREGLSFYLLGGEGAVNAACAAILHALYPKLRIAGRRHGFFEPSDEEALVAEINGSGADIVWIGLGKPREQVFSTRIRDRLTCRWIITCGGCFNFVTGTYSRAPGWMQRTGLEWLHRLATNPAQLMWRYLTTNPVAVYWMLRESR